MCQQSVFEVGEFSVTLLTPVHPVLHVYHFFITFFGRTSFVDDIISFYKQNCAKYLIIIACKIKYRIESEFERSSKFTTSLGTAQIFIFNLLERHPIGREITRSASSAQICSFEIGSFAIIPPSDSITFLQFRIDFYVSADQGAQIFSSTEFSHFGSF